MLGNILTTHIIACLEALGYKISINKDDSIINGVNTLDLIKSG